MLLSLSPSSICRPRYDPENELEVQISITTLGEPKLEVRVHGKRNGNYFSFCLLSLRVREEKRGTFKQ